ncbi:MAG: hypothetical protein LBE67_07840 [Kocuria palustris]|nr:hypothetical protein [Kocuria palustris]
MKDVKGRALSIGCPGAGIGRPGCADLTIRVEATYRTRAVTSGASELPVRCRRRPEVCPRGSVCVLRRPRARGVFDALPAHLASDLTSRADERPSGPVRGGQCHVQLIDPT